MKTTFQRLDNDLVLGVAKNKHLNSVAVLVAVRVGSRDEPKGMHGAAHFLEHMLFRGTKRRPNSLALTGLVESKGGDCNAFTDKDLTCLHVRMVKNDGLVAVDVVHDMIANPLLRTADVKQERVVVRDEIAASDNDPNQTLWKLSESIAYAGTGLEHPVLGTDVDFSAASLRKFFRYHYVPRKMAVVLAGAVDDEVIAEATRLFGSLPYVPSVSNSKMVHVEHMAPEPPPPGVSFKVAGTDRLDVVMRFPGVPEGHPHDRALELLMLALGGFSSGRLFQSLRERDGLCYAIQASVEGHRGVGSAIITTELSPEKFGLAMQAIWKEVWAVRKRGLSVEELKAVKAYSQANVLLQKDQPLQVAEEAARAVLLSRYETPAEEIRRIDAVTLEDIRVVAKLYLDLTKVHVAVVGPASARRSVEKPIAAPWLW